MKITEHDPSLMDLIHWHKMKILAAVFDDAHHAHELAGQLVEHDFPMDQISVLHRAAGQGDDFLGVAYESERERTKIWAENGALWGALAGLAVGASGLLFVPGVGLLLALGPVIDVIAGSAIGSGIMAGAAAVTRLTAALHRMGIPEDKTEELHRAIMAGKTLLILHYDKNDPTDWQQIIDWSRAEAVQVFP
ncbi:MAG TPA: hypothetical protein ENI98_09985 [Gammaproteobacteria bacterium]|nr:hypothetical protein [Gammaproteobacteria bacterium]